jgi:ferredoxin-type protein NapF
MNEKQVKLNRMQFLRGNFDGKKSPIRPPWAKPEIEFVELCEYKCEKCIQICPTNILVLGRNKFPHVDFSKGECDFCGLCVDNCKYNALEKNLDDEFIWNIKANIENKCLSINAITCRVCGEHCDLDAIKFKLQIGGKAIPKIDLDICNGCGACFVPCPINAININNVA